MDRSERLERWKESLEDLNDLYEKDRILANRIKDLLNHPGIDDYCMVDAYYYDYSVIPQAVKDVLDIHRDAYLIYGITEYGQIVSKWVDRWDLDSDNPIENGIVIRKEKDNHETSFAYLHPIIMQTFDNKLLSTPTPEFMIENNLVE